MSPRVPPRRAGFTLVELLVGMSIGILLVVILFQIFNVAASAWQRGENQIDAYREARAALQFITRDLSSVSVQFPIDPAASPAPLPTDGGIAPTLVLDKYPDPVPKRDDLDLKNEEAYFMTTVSNPPGLSALCAVGYFCQWLPDVAKKPADPTASHTDHAPRAYSIYRQFLGSGQVNKPGLFELLALAKSRPIAFLEIFPRSSPNPDSPLSSGIAATAVEMASYVWDLQFRIDTNLSAARASAQPPSDHGDRLPSGVKRFYTSLAGQEHPAALPPYVEVRFKALSAGGARQLEGNTAVTRSTWWDASSAFYQRVILPSTQQFVARVPLQNAPPAATVTP